MTTMHDWTQFGIIWDLDGTLVDTSELHYQAWSTLARELSKPLSREAFEATFGRRNAEIVRLLLGGEYSDEVVLQLGERKEELYRAAAAGEIELLPGARSLLESLPAAGFQQAIGSSAPRANVDLILRLTHTERIFSVIVSMEDTQRGKPDPQVFQVAAERLGIPPDKCVVIEDAVAGVQAAKAGSMVCIAVRFGGHHSTQALRQAGADLVCESLQEVSLQTIKELIGGS
jgi:beta-phosphoglucomutase